MKIIETTQPIERTFDLKDLSSKELSAIRRGLSKIKDELIEERVQQNDQRKSMYMEQVNDSTVCNLGIIPAPLPPNEEELMVGNMIALIRTMERKIFPKG